MIYLILAILSSAMVSVTMRIGETKAKYPLGLLAVNYMMCTMLSVLFAQSLSASAAARAFGVISGMFYLGSFVLMQWNIQHNGVVMSSTFMKMGVLVPIIASMIFFGEIPNLMQLAGLCLALAAIVLLKEKHSSKKLLLVPLLALLIGGGMTDFTSKIFEQLFLAYEKDGYLFWTFCFAMFFCIVYMMTKKQKITKDEWMFGALIGIPNYFSARFLLLSLANVDAIIAYPTYSVATILMVTLLGKCLFQERLSERHMKVMGLILLALILLNLS